MSILLRIFKIFSRFERLTFIAAFLIFIASSLFVSINFLSQRTVLTPISGGEYLEGIVGQPAFINPVLISNNEVDRDLVELIFSGLKDLAESYKTNEDGTIWNVRLKENLFWHDNRSISSDDLVFTIKAIQDPDTQSPLFPLWQNVSVERISEREIKIVLPENYAFFKNLIEDFKPIPKHLFAEIAAANFRLSEYNLRPIGSGPFKFEFFQKERSGFIKEYFLKRNNSYFRKPYIERLGFKFYQNEEELIEVFNFGLIDALGGIDYRDISKIKINHQVFELVMSRYYAVFFNPNAHQALKDKNVRLALYYATDKKDLIEKIFNNKAILINGPLIPGMKDYAAEVYPQKQFSIEKANQILENSDWKLNEEGVRERTLKQIKEKLEFELIVPQMPFLIEAANFIKENWLKTGVKLNLTILPLDEINSKAIKSRNYQMIIFGNIFSDRQAPDLFSFWHSSERFYPGLNLALYENKTADILIESIRKTLNEEKRQRDLTSLQSLIIQDSPAIFLFSPYYFYITKNWLKGFDGEQDRRVDKKFISLASDRFKNIEKWYIKTARAFR